MKRVLMVAEKFPPFNVSGSARPFYFAKYLPEHGYQPLVLSSRVLRSEDRDESLLAELPSVVRVWRTPRLFSPLSTPLRQLNRRRERRAAGSGPKPATPPRSSALTERSSLAASRSTAT